jgi:hypothetical protein
MVLAIYKGYVTTLGSVSGKGDAELERTLGFNAGSLKAGFDIYRLLDPVAINEFDWRDRTRYSAGWHIDPTIPFGSNPNVRWAVQRRDELRAALERDEFSLNRFGIERNADPRVGIWIETKTVAVVHVVRSGKARDNAHAVELGNRARI